MFWLLVNYSNSLTSLIIILMLCSIFAILATTLVLLKLMVRDAVFTSCASDDACSSFRTMGNRKLMVCENVNTVGISIEQVHYILYKQTRVNNYNIF